MPRPGMRWRLITINTKNSWHHGSPRGFRSRDHRVHSNGDYRNPPPKDEHAGLLRYRKERSEEKIRLPRSVRDCIAKTLSKVLTEAGYRVLAISVSSDHAHIVVELPDNVRQVKAIIGDAKRLASRAIKRTHPGSVWSAGCDYEPVDDRPRLKSEVEYVLLKQGADSWTWSFRDGGMWCGERLKRREQALSRRGRAKRRPGFGA